MNDRFFSFNKTGKLLKVAIRFLRRPQEKLLDGREAFIGLFRQSLADQQAGPDRCSKAKQPNGEEKGSQDFFVQGRPRGS